MRAAVGAATIMLAWLVVSAGQPAYGSYSHTYLPGYGDFDVPNAINNRGEVVLSGTLGFGNLWQGGAHYTPLGYATPACINDQGQIVGYSELPRPGVYSAVTWSNGAVVPLALPLGAGESHALSINNSGAIVGDCILADSTRIAVLWQDGRIRRVGGAGSMARCINDIGQVAGESWVSGLARATVWKGGVATYLPPLAGYADSRALSINNQGIAVGVSSNGNYDRATMWRDGVAIDLGSLGGEYSAALCINDSDDIVGVSIGSDGRNHATLWANGGITDLGMGLYGSTAAVSINDVGQIVGTNSDPEYPLTYAVLWQPVPEPASAVALLSGLAGAIFALPRRRKQGN